jgi:AraC-like DNA-binding protein
VALGFFGAHRRRPSGTLFANRDGAMHMPRTVVAGTVRRIVEYGLAKGVEPRRMRRDAGIDAGAVEPGDGRVSTDNLFGLWECLARTLREPAVPIRVAERARLEDLHVLGFAIQTAPTLAHGLKTLFDYGCLLTTSGTWSLVTSGTRAELVWRRPTTATLGVRLSNETAVAQCVGALRQLLGSDFDPVEVRFRHDRPADVSSHDAFFRARVRFGAKNDGVVISRDLLDAASPGANAALWGYLCRDAAARSERVRSGSFSDLVLDAVVRSLDDAPNRVPSMTDAAAALGTTERTLRRRLSDEGTSFRALVEGARRERTLALLEGGGVSLTAAAFEAGFSDPSALTHACRRWFGRTPRDLRARRAQSASAARTAR